MSMNAILVKTCTSGCANLVTYFQVFSVLSFLLFFFSFFVLFTLKMCLPDSHASMWPFNLEVLLLLS